VRGVPADRLAALTAVFGILLATGSTQAQSDPPPPVSPLPAGASPPEPPQPVPAPPPAPPAEVPPPAPPTATSESEAAPPLPPPPPPPPRQYADEGTSEIGIGLGYSSVSGFLAAGGYRYFVLEGLGPGLEATYVSGGRDFTAYGLVLASLRFVPVRAGNIAIVLTGRGGRVLLGDNHDDGWGVGGAAGILLMFGGGAGLELGWQVLRLVPSSFCADLSTCTLQGPVLGLRISF
jgi:hypothetical protein